MIQGNIVCKLIISLPVKKRLLTCKLLADLLRKTKTKHSPMRIASEVYLAMMTWRGITKM